MIERRVKVRGSRGSHNVKGDNVMFYKNLCIIDKTQKTGEERREKAE